MAGIIIAFMRYLPAKGLFDSPWVGFGNYRVLFNMPGFFQAIRNTLIISSSKIVLSIIVPVSFTILLNEINIDPVKKGIQTLIYLPYFISWVLLAGIFIKLLGGSGIVNQALGVIGVGPIIFLGNNFWFRVTVIATDIWKEFGYGTIVYLAAVSSVDPNLYEAARVDGAGHWKQMIHITLPSLTTIIVLMSVLKVGSILNAGFDQIFNLYNSTVYESGDIIDTLVYRIAFGTGQFGLSTAAGLSKSLVASFLVILSHKFAHRISGYRVF
jgi:putative aldouronate transport system permease protein